LKQDDFCQNLTFFVKIEGGLKQNKKHLNTIASIFELWSIFEPELSLYFATVDLKLTIEPDTEKLSL
jgi:hypothetical protein